MVRALATATAVGVVVTALGLAAAPRAAADAALLVAGPAPRTAAPAAWPSVAAIVRADVADARSGQICTGTVVGAYAVLTAASCVSTSGIPLSPASVHVVTGRPVLSTAAGERLPVAQVHLAPGADVAVLHLAVGTTAPVMRTATAAQSAALVVSGQEALIAGWGTPAGPADALLETPARFAAPATTCPGDRGGPVVRSDSAGVPLQVGVLRSSPSACDGSVLQLTTMSDIAAWLAPVIASTLPVIPPPVRPVGTPTPPLVNARPSVRRTWTATIRRGRTVRLRYQVDDDSLRTRETITIINPRGRVVKRVRKPLQTLSPEAVYGISFKVPRKARLGRWRFCVEARDAEGLRDRECRIFRVRR